MTILKDETFDTEGNLRRVREWDPDVSDTATVTVYDAEGNVVSTSTVDVSAERQAVLAERAADEERDIAKAAFRRLDQIIANADTATTTQLRGAIADLARMVKAIGRRELAD